MPMPPHQPDPLAPPVGGVRGMVWRTLAAYRRVPRWVWWLLGIALVVAALGVALWGVDWQALREAGPWALPALASLVLLNVLLTGTLFWAVTLPFDARPTVPWWLTVKLIAASALLNYLPLRVGLIGRAAWLKASHGLPLRQSVLILAAVLAVNVVVLGVVLAGVLLLPMDAGVAEPGIAKEVGWRPWAAVAALIVVSLLTRPVAGWLLRRPCRGAMWWVPIRTVDLIVGVARLHLAFVLVGADEVGFDAVLVASVAGSVISMAGLTPNGLGLKEWAIAGLAPLLDPVGAAVAAAAAVLDRGVETITIGATGGVAVGVLKRIDI